MKKFLAFAAICAATFTTPPGVATEIPGIIKCTGTNSARTDDLTVTIVQNSVPNQGFGDYSGWNYLIVTSDPAVILSMKQNPAFPSDDTKKIPANFVSAQGALDAYNALT